MHNKNRFKIRENIRGLFGLVVFLVVLMMGFIFFSYLLIIAAVIGLIFFTMTYLRAKLFSKPAKKKGASKGRTIEHE